MDSILNLIKLANEQKPADFVSELEILLKQKAMETIANEKLNLAKHMFNNTSDEEDDDVEEDDVEEDDVEDDDVEDDDDEDDDD